MQVVKRILLLVLLSLLGGCYSTTGGGTLETDRWQLMIVPPILANGVSNLTYYYQVHPYERDQKINQDTAQVARIEKIVERLKPHMTIFREDVSEWEWDVRVATSLQVNAFALAGGKVVVYSNIIKTLDLTDEEFALLLGHEISHGLREHSRERMGDILVYTALAYTVLSGTISAIEAVIGGAAYGLLRSVVFDLPIARQQEKEADHMGLELVARAGYDPRKAINLFRKMDKSEDARWWWDKGIFATHPDTPDRVTDLEAQLEKVMPLYEAAVSHAR